jgi:hypothetical protein
VLSSVPLYITVGFNSWLRLLRILRLTRAVRKQAVIATANGLYMQKSHGFTLRVLRSP